MTDSTLHNFVHLRVRSDFSITNGVMKIKEIISLAGQYQMPAIAVSDLNMFCGLIKLYENATTKGIKPLAAIDTQFLDNRGVLHDITLYARTERGYVNLRRIMTETYVRARSKVEQKQFTRSLTNQKRDVRLYITYEQMRENAEGLLCLLPAYFGPLGNSARADKIDFADDCYHTLKDIFGNYLFQGIARCGRPGEKALEPYVLEYAKEYNLPLVATNDVMFKRRSDFTTHQIRECIAQGVIMNEYAPDYTQEQYFKSSEEMRELFADLPIAIENTGLVAQLCTVRFKLGHHDLPRFHLNESDPKQKALKEEFNQIISLSPEIDEEEWILEKLASRGLEERLKVLYPDQKERETKRSMYEERLAYELGIIKSMKFPGYFLIVQEFINWSKNKGIPVGPGRGSGAGSLVAYALRITDLDPLKYALLFERFLNPERKSMPDFDVDFCNEGRSRVIEHMQEHYGKDSVSQIMTYGTMGAKMVVKDVARVMRIDRHKADDLARALMDKIEVTSINEKGEEVIQSFKGNLENNIKYNDAFRAYYESPDEPEYRHIIEYSKPLEGLIRQVGKHAAGIVISPIDMNEYSAMYISEDGEQSTHFDKDDIERAGLVKFDFLGLKNLTIIKNALRMIEKKCKREGIPMIDIDNLPLDDKESYDLLQRGDTHGIFQLESQGITKLVMKACPKTFEDIIALIALYRPGPLQSGMVDNYINRKNGIEEIFYPTEELNFKECLKETLDPTYGVIVYQEQVMQIAQKFANYNLGGADNLRRAMGKKKPEEMAKERGKFVAGAIDNGYTAEQAERLFDLVDKFAGYGFNKSHSAAYALISYQTAYLKAHFRAEFLAAVLTNGQSDISKIYSTIRDLKHAQRNIKVEYIRPSINYSFEHFDVDCQGRIIYSLAALKGVGAEVVKEMVKERERNGLFTDFYNFIERCGHYFSETQLKVMINAGAFDDLIEKANSQWHCRETYQHVLKPIIQAVKNSDHGNLFMDLTEDINTYVNEKIFNEVEKWDIAERSRREYDAYNFYFDGHPIIEFAAERDALADCKNIAELRGIFSKYEEDILKGNAITGSKYRSYGLILNVDNARKSKSFDGKKQIIDLALSDETDSYRGDMFPQYQSDLSEMVDNLVTDGKAYVVFNISSYTNKQTGETRASMRIREAIPLQDYLYKCRGEITALFDVRKQSGIDKMYQFAHRFHFDPNLATERDNLVKVRFFYYTRFGVSNRGEFIFVKYSIEMARSLKNICGIHNIIFDMEYDKSLPGRDEGENKLYQKALPQNNIQQRL